MRASTPTLSNQVLVHRRAPTVSGDRYTLSAELLMGCFFRRDGVQVRWIATDFC